MGRKSRVTIDDVMRSMEVAKAIRQDLVKLRKHLLLAAMKIDKILKETLKKELFPMQQSKPAEVAVQGPLCSD